jgi:hypothetical protein
MLDAGKLAREVRATKQLSGTAKRYWLRVLPHLRDEDRQRLAGILRGGDAQPAQHGAGDGGGGESQPV